MSGSWLVPAVLALSTTLCSLGQDDLDFLGTLELVQLVFRHGARSPIYTYLSDPFTEQNWGVKWGQLTKLGEEQQYQLGAYLRERYANFLPERYSRDDAYARSSDADRALVSSVLLMSGLYPELPPTPPPTSVGGLYLATQQTADDPFRKVYWQTVPVHTVPEDIDQLLPIFASPCSAFQAEVDKVNRSIEYQCFKNRTTYLEDFSSKAGGTPAMILYDSLQTKACHGLMVPFWSRGVYPQPLNSYNDWNVFFGVASTAPLRRMFVGKLVHEIVEHMDMKIRGTLKPDRKLFAYGAHDSNLLALLSALNVWNGLLPPFSSCVLIELRLNSRNEHVITVSYKNDTSLPPHLLKIPGCRSIACPYHEFVAAVASDMFDEGECEDKPDLMQPLVFHLPTAHLRDEWRQCFNV